jgi:hypothetical protein
VRVELEIPAPGLSVPSARSRARTPAARRRLDRFDLGLLAVFGLVSVWVLALDLWQVVVHGRTWTGTDGLYLVDQMQYLAWIRDASHHLLASNLFVLHSTPADYFQPAVAISGVLAALGVAPWLALILWKPVAVAAAFFAFRRYARRSVSGVWPRRVVLILALFYGSFSIVYGSFSVIGDLFPGFLSWGYTFGLLALAAMVAALLSYDRARSSGGSPLAPGLLGALAGSLHPWQGELLILIVLCCEALVWWRGERRMVRLKLVAVTVVVTALPLAYYAILGRADVSWALAREASKHSFALWTIVLALLPLLVPALLGYRRRPASFLELITCVWPVTALVVFVASATELSATPLHAFDGVTVPLAVLAVKGLTGLKGARLPRADRRRLLGALAVGVVTIPATAYELVTAAVNVAPNVGNANFISRDEKRAITYLAHDKQRGGVITRFYLGAIIPAETGRRTFVGHCLWSEPGCDPRSEIAQQLIDGTLPASAARSLVLTTGARFVLSDCLTNVDLTRVLGSLVRKVDRFGCASVYEIA